MAATSYGYNEVQTSPTWMAALPIVAAVTVPFFGMITALLGATWFLGVIMAGFTLVPALHYRNQSEHLARGLITALVLLVGIVLLTIIYPIPGGLIGAPLHGLTVTLVAGSGSKLRFDPATHHRYRTVRTARVDSTMGRSSAGSRSYG